MSQLLVKRDEYTPTGWDIISTYLTVQIYSNFARTTVKMNIEASNSDSLPPLFLHGQNLDLEKVVINNITQQISDIQKNKDSLIFNLSCSSNEIEIVTLCNPFENTTLEGLYKSGDMICSQCEPEGFRRICYYPDRPDMMSVFTTRIEADISYKNLLSNGNLIASGKIGHERHFAVWNDPFPKPSYLFALVAGDLEKVEDIFITASGRRVKLIIYVEHGNSHLTSHAMESLKKSMKWDEETYGLEYDLDLFQIVAVSHFNMGAMENKGLNIFNSKFVLADEKTASDSDLLRVESIIAHEYFHNWSGNRVTCRDWFQLTLKEGLTVYRDQCFTADLHDAFVKRIEDVSLLRSVQFPEDAGPMAHPIRPESYSEINNFYTPTIYEKGAEVIRMLATIFGKDGFRKGVALYFKRHDGQAVTCDDFLKAMEDANNLDLSLFSYWYQQLGTPSLQIIRNKKASEIEMMIVQKKPENGGKHYQAMMIPFRFSLNDKTGNALSLIINGKKMGVEPLIIINEEETVLSIRSADKSRTNDLLDATPSYLRGFSAPVNLCDDRTIDDYIHLISSDSDPFVIWDSMQLLYSKVIIQDYKDDKDINLELRLSNALLKSLKNQKLNNALKALLLLPPSQSVLLTKVVEPDPPRIFLAKQNVLRRMSLNIQKYLQKKLDIKISYFDTMDSSGRSLHNQLLAWGMLGGMGIAQTLALKQVSSFNMTLVKGSISALNHIDVPSREIALERFHDNWKTNSLVMENWFMWQSSSVVKGTVKKCRELMKHPSFDANNPNKLRAVIGSFANGNPVHFHANDCSGYEFLAEQLLKIDKKNSQISANLALPLTQFANFSSERKGLMLNILKKLNENNLSSDLSEVVKKSLGSSDN